MAGRYAKLLLVPEGEGELRQLRIPLWTLRAALVSLILLVVFVISAGVIFFHQLHVQEEMLALREQNRALRAEVVHVGEQLSELDGTIRAHVRLANESRLLAGLPPYSEDVALLGVGGTPLGDYSKTNPMLTPALGRTVEVYRERMKQLYRQLDFQEESFVEVKQLIEANRDRLDHIPTVNPVLGSHYLSSGFGKRRDPFTGQPAHHPGVDFASQVGTPFRSTAAGVVIFAGKNGGYGLTIKVDHGNEFVTVYGHCNKILVKKGQAVRRGDVIGEIGNTGRSTGPHLHYEVHKQGRAVNPRPYLL